MFWWRTLCLQGLCRLPWMFLAVSLAEAGQGLVGVLKALEEENTFTTWVKAPESVLQQGKEQNEVISLLAEDVKSHQSYEEDFTWTCGTLLWMPLTVLPKAFHKHERVPNVKVSKSRNPKKVRLWGSEVLGWLSRNVLEPRSLGHEAYFGCAWAFLSHSSPSSCSLILKIFGIFFQLNRSLNNMHCFFYQIDDFTFLCRER